MTFGSLFSGIGGMDLGLERAGMECRWQVEIDPFARRVLEKHWPAVTRYEDVRTLDGRTVTPVDLLCGGFPCQPHSLAGRRRASEDERDLWGEFARLIREVRPRWVLAENVPGLLSSEAGRFFGRVLGDLAACGYDAEWDCLPAAAVGAPHRRDRAWIVACPQREQLRHESGRRGWASGADSPESRDDGAAWSVADADHQGESGRTFDDGAGLRLSQFTRGHQWWRVEPNVGRVAHGVPARMDRLRGLGNAVVPQVVEFIGARILEADEAMRAA